MQNASLLPMMADKAVRLISTAQVCNQIILTAMVHLPCAGRSHSLHVQETSAILVLTDVQDQKRYYNYRLMNHKPATTNPVPTRQNPWHILLKNAGVYDNGYSFHWLH